MFYCDFVSSVHSGEVGRVIPSGRGGDHFIYRNGVHILQSRGFFFFFFLESVDDIPFVTRRCSDRNTSLGIRGWLCLGWHLGLVSATEEYVRCGIWLGCGVALRGGFVGLRNGVLFSSFGDFCLAGLENIRVYVFFGRKKERRSF